MALKATIFKAELQLADMDRNLYDQFNLTLARHPSETDERLMVRLLAFCLHADEHLQFTKGLCADDEPDLWQKTLTGEIEHWIDVGQPDLKRIRKACGRARRVSIYCYGARTASMWWKQLAPEVERFSNLQIRYLPQEATHDMAELVERNMQLQCTVQEGLIWLGSTDKSVSIEPEEWFGQDS